MISMPMLTRLSFDHTEGFEKMITELNERLENQVEPSNNPVESRQKQDDECLPHCFANKAALTLRKTQRSRRRLCIGFVGPGIITVHTIQEIPESPISHKFPRAVVKSCYISCGTMWDRSRQWTPFSLLCLDHASPKLYQSIYYSQKKKRKKAWDEIKRKLENGFLSAIFPVWWCGDEHN